MRELNREFLAVATELQPLKSLAVYHVGILPEGATYLPEDAPFKLDPSVPRKEFPSESIEKLTKKELELRFAQGGAMGNRLEGFVIGYFGRGELPTHALVVNLDYRTYGGNGLERQKEFLNPVCRYIVGPGRLEFFDAAQSEWLKADANKVELKLLPGSGILVRVAQ